MFPYARLTQYTKVNFWAERKFAHRMTVVLISPKGQDFCIGKKRPTLKAFPGLHDDVRIVDCSSFRKETYGDHQTT